MLSAVDESKPNRMTMAMGASSSLPGLPAPSASGISARPAASAVIKMGDSRSTAPRRIAWRKSLTPSSPIRCLMWEIIMIPLRVAIPNRVMNPMMDATESTPPERKTPTTPPISANGRLNMMTTASEKERKAAVRMTRIPSITARPSHSSKREASASLSNWPPYSTW